MRSQLVQIILYKCGEAFDSVRNCAPERCFPSIIIPYEINSRNKLHGNRRTKDQCQILVIFYITRGGFATINLDMKYHVVFLARVFGLSYEYFDSQYA